MKENFKNQHITMKFILSAEISFIEPIKDHITSKTPEVGGKQVNLYFRCYFFKTYICINV